jgi:SAM-dependent methyltransferase
MVVERFDPPPKEQERDPWYGVHVARYLWALDQLGAAGRVLDVSCGNGYGMGLMASNGFAVVGVDNDREAVVTARRHGPVVLADASRLPFRSSSFQRVTSFETIEHLADRRSFVEELGRVLSKGGVLLLSTPNARYTLPIDGRPRNPYHVHEYDPDELRTELSATFDVTDFLGQRLNARFRLSPFVDDQRRMPRSLRSILKLAAWRVLIRLPAAIADRASAVVLQQPVVPLPTDYVFTEEGRSEAPVVVVRANVRADDA